MMPGFHSCTVAQHEYSFHDTVLLFNVATSIIQP